MCFVFTSWLLFTITCSVGCWVLVFWFPATDLLAVFCFGRVVGLSLLLNVGSLIISYCFYICVAFGLCVVLTFWGYFVGLGFADCDCCYLVLLSLLWFGFVVFCVC